MTSLREKLAERARPYLGAGEEVQQVFLAQSGPNPNFFALSALVYLASKYRIVAVTNRAIVVLAAKGFFRQSSPKQVLERLARETPLGPLSGALWSRVNLPCEKPSWVHRRFYRDVEAADAALPGT